MQYPVILQSRSEHEFVAEPLGKPELAVKADSRDRALAEVGKSLRSWLGSAQMVQVDVPGSAPLNPWIETLGQWADDPDFDELMNEIAYARAVEDRK